MTQPPGRIRGSTGQPEGAAPKRDLTRSRTGRVSRRHTGYQAPDGLRRMGAARLERWLRDCGAYNASDIATRAIQAATAQRTTVIGQDVAACCRFFHMSAIIHTS